MKAIFRYPGSKWTIAPWIIDHFPEGYEKMVYLEPFAGSLAVFFNKMPGTIEVVNDLDGDIVNFFRVLRERPDELKRAIYLTPYSREEYDRSFEVCEDPLERARRFAVIANMGVGSKRSTKSGWQCYASKDPGGCVVKWSSVMDVIKPAADRLRGKTTNLVHIENTDALELIKRFDSKDVLMYVDPPYVRKTRKSGELYKHEMDDMQHLDLLRTLAKTKAKVVLSGYDCDWYNQELPGWHKDQIPARLTVGMGIETIWMNYQPVIQMSLNLEGDNYADDDQWNACLGEQILPEEGTGQKAPQEADRQEVAEAVRVQVGAGAESCICGGCAWVREGADLPPEGGGQAGSVGEETGGSEVSGWLRSV